MQIVKSICVAGAFLTAACAQPPSTSTEGVQATDALIADQPHDGGMPGFAFVPPTVLRVPSRPEGTFDPDVVAVARVCAGVGVCDTERALASFSSSVGTGGGPLARLRAIPALQVYTAVWDTRICAKGPCKLKAGAAYRLHVYAATPAGGELELGFADLQVIAAGSPPRLDLDNFSPLVVNRPYVMAFRIEKHPRPPEVHLLSPFDGAATSATTAFVEVAFQANTDLLTGAVGSVTAVDLLVDGAVAASQTCPPGAKSGTLGFVVDLGGSTDRAVALQAVAYQGSRTAGLRGDSSVVRVLLDRTPPAVLFSAPALNALSLNDGTVSAEISYADALAGVLPEGLHLELDGLDVSADLTLSSGQTGSYRPSVPLSEGPHTYRAWAADRAGNASTVSVVPFHVAFGEAVARVGPTGGSVTVDNPASPLVGVSFAVPAGAVSSEAVLKIVQSPGVTAPMLGGKLEGVSLPAFEIVPHLQGLRIPATIRVPLPDADRDGFVDGSNFHSENAHLFYRVASGDDWTRVETYVDVARGFIEARTLHASQWVPGYFRWPYQTCITYAIEQLPEDYAGVEDSFTAGTAQAQLASALRAWESASVFTVYFRTSGCPAGSPELRLTVQDNLVALDRETSLTFPASAATDTSGLEPLRISVNSSLPYPDGTPGTQFYTAPYATSAPYASNHTPWLRTVLHEVGHFVGLADHSQLGADQTPANPEQWNVCSPASYFGSLTTADVMYRDHDCGGGLPLTQLGTSDSREGRHHYGYVWWGDLTIDDVSCSPTTIPLTGWLNCTATINNRTSRQLSRIRIMTSFRQGAAYRQPYAELVNCGEAGVVAPGSCTMSFSASLSQPAGSSQGTIVPGDATATFWLGQSNPGGQTPFVYYSDGMAIRFTSSGGSGSVSGRVSGAVAAGVQVRLTGASTATTTTDSSGAFTFGGVPNGTHTITPTLAGYSFSPGSRSTTVNDDQVTGLDFVAVTSAASSVGAGADFSCALVNGGVRCWGYNAYGQLGNGSTTDSTGPVLVVGLASDVRAIAVRDYHTCALVSGDVRCWGYNAYGQLGNGSTTASSVPVQVPGLTSGVEAITAGGYHTCAIVNGRVQCWGYNASGQLGSGSTTSSPVPVQVPGLESGVEAIAAGRLHTCAIVNGGVRCWGSNAYGQLGNGSVTDSSGPVQVGGLTSGVSAVAAGDYHTCALVNGGVQCWGYNYSGALGTGTDFNGLVLVPAQVSGLTSGAEAVAAGRYHTCAIVSGGVQCWGYGYDGEIGNGSATYSPVPAQVLGLTNGGEAITASWRHTCAVVNGGVQCWGWNAHGQLGNGTTVDSLVPVQVLNLATGG